MIPMYPVGFNSGGSILDGVFTSFWNCDDAAGAALADAIGANNLAVSGAPGSVAGKVLNARSLSAGGAFIQAGSNVLGAGVTTFAIAGWLNTSLANFAAQSAFFYKNAPNLIAAGILRQVAGVDVISFLLNDGGGNQVILDTTGPVSKNVWLWWYVDFDGATMRLMYINSAVPAENSSVSSGGMPPTFLVGAAAEFIFGDVAGGGQRTTASIDATGVVHNGVLSVAERDAHYNAGAGIQYPF